MHDLLRSLDQRAVASDKNRSDSGGFGAGDVSCGVVTNHPHVVTRIRELHPVLEDASIRLLRSHRGARDRRVDPGPESEVSDEARKLGRMVAE